MPAQSSSALKKTADMAPAGAAEQPPARVLPIMGIPVHDLDWSQALLMLEEKLVSSDTFTHIAFLNANNANVMARDPDYRDVLGRSLVLPDGIGVDIAAHFLNGGRFTANLNGTDFVPAALSFITRPLRVGLLGATSEVLQAAAMNFRKHTPWHEFFEISDGYFDRADPALILKRIETARIDLLLVAMGTPLQEKWVDKHLSANHARVVISVGALLDFVSGRVARAPGWVRQMRSEWLYRLWLEPSRLWRRYVLGIPVFLAHVLHHRLRVPRQPQA
jgi:exopolysaccharide biosynthesis WecB/TagA/CpsF family protein